MREFGKIYIFMSNSGCGCLLFCSFLRRFCTGFSAPYSFEDLMRSFFPVAFIFLVFLFDAQAASLTEQPPTGKGRRRENRRNTDNDNLPRGIDNSRLAKSASAGGASAIMFYFMASFVSSNTTKALVAAIVGFAIIGNIVHYMLLP
jgi:hypothetical protein